MRTPSGLRIDSPSWPLLQALISYWGTTDNDGNVAGTTIRCGGLATEPPYENHALKILSGPSAGQTRDLTLHPAGTDTLTVANAFTNVTGAAQQITAGIRFVVLSKTPAIAEVAALTALVVALMADVGDPTGDTLPDLATKWGDIARSLDLILGARWDGAGDLGTDIVSILADIAAIEAKLDAGAPKLYVEQIPDTDIDETVTDTETDCVLVTLPYIAARTYCLRYLRLKCADPGVGRTVTVKLYERWNDAIAQLIDSFDINSTNFATYHSLIDMFGVPEIHSDAILIRAVHDGASPGDDVAIEVTYRHAVATT